jgi:hypothetical protein
MVILGLFETEIKNEARRGSEFTAAHVQAQLRSLNIPGHARLVFNPTCLISIRIGATDKPIIVATLDWKLVGRTWDRSGIEVGLVLFIE